jgi:flavin reductase (DIM6/NTAB) family NADH-FMN oxidoreductase RutF
MEYIDIKFNEQADIMLNQLQKGAFITTKVQDKVNTMTIAWGGINVIWNKKVFIAYVRYSRDTYNMIEESDEFTISIPHENDLKKELSFCGTKSGRDYDKIKECNLKTAPSRVIDTPILADCKLHYECKVIYKQALEPGNIPSESKKRHYPNNDYHVAFYGEIVDSYLTKGEK